MAKKQEEEGGSRGHRRHHREGEAGTVSADIVLLLHSLLSMVLVWRCLNIGCGLVKGGSRGF